MVERELPTKKFGLSEKHGFMDDGSLRQNSTSADSQAELKKELLVWAA